MLPFIKSLVPWALTLVALDYPYLFRLLLHVALGFLQYEFQGIFCKICNSQTGKSEENYISRLSASILPYLLVQVFLFSGSISPIYPEQVLCILLILSTVFIGALRGYQYSNLCFETTDKKKKPKKQIDSKNKETNSAFVEIYEWVRISALCFLFIMGDTLFLISVVLPYTYSVLLLGVP